jgi:hypothetical protein
MSSEERRKILQMVADGKISAEEAANLMRALDEDAEAESTQGGAGFLGGASGMGGERSDAPEIDEVRRRAMRFSSAFLWIGVIFTILSAWAMYGIQQNAGLNFWFYCMSTPLFLGILLIALGASSRTSRWLYVDVDRTRSRDHDGPRHISLAFPLPLGLASWFLRNFGGRIEGLKNTNIDDVVQVIAMAKNLHDPLIVHVDDGDDGERVQVFIG